MFSNPSFWSLFEAGEAMAGEAAVKILCMDGEFEVTQWCLYHSDILFRFLKGIVKCNYQYFFV